MIKGAVESGGDGGRILVAEVGGGDGVIREMQFPGGIQGQDSRWWGSDGGCGGSGGGVKFGSGRRKEVLEDDVTEVGGGGVVVEADGSGGSSGCGGEVMVRTRVKRREINVFPNFFH